MKPTRGLGGIGGWPPISTWIIAPLMVITKLLWMLNTLPSGMRLCPHIQMTVPPQRYFYLIMPLLGLVCLNGLLLVMVNTFKII